MSTAEGYLGYLRANYRELDKRAHEYKTQFKELTSPGRQLSEDEVPLLVESWHGHLSNWIAYREHNGGSLLPLLTDGQWYAPIRVIYEEVMGEAGRIWTEFRTISVVDNTLEAVRKAREEGIRASRSWVRNVIGIEVLLSGPLKLSNQKKPKWMNISSMSKREAKKWSEYVAKGKEELRAQGYSFPGDEDF